MCVLVDFCIRTNNTNEHTMKNERNRFVCVLCWAHAAAARSYFTSSSAYTSHCSLTVIVSRCTFVKAKRKAPTHAQSALQRSHCIWRVPCVFAEIDWVGCETLKSVSFEVFAQALKSHWFNATDTKGFLPRLFMGFELTTDVILFFGASPVLVRPRYRHSLRTIK